MPCQVVDGEDFFAVYDAARTAIDRARAGEGPSMLHIKLNRYFGHFEGDAQTYRGPAEVERLRREKDCLQLFRRRVTDAGLLELAAFSAIDTEVSTEIDAAVQEAKAAAQPSAADLTTHVYAMY